MKPLFICILLPFFIFSFSHSNLNEKNHFDKTIAGDISLTQNFFTSSDSLPKRFTQIAAGGTFSIALRDDSTVWSWGDNTYGQLGCGNIPESKSPVQVLLPSGIIAISAGPNHALALRKDGTVWSWGENSFGQLGDSTNISNRIPAQIKSLSGIIAVAAGGFDYTVNINNSPYGGAAYGMGSVQNYSPYTRRSGFSVALKKDGTVWNWGSDSRCNGELIGAYWVPKQVENLTDIIAIAAGGFHALALTNEGNVWAWGDNGFAQLGDDSHTSRYCVAKEVSLLKKITAIAASGNHSIALASDSTVWTWGDNPQVYNATRHFSYLPENVRNLNGIISISAGSNHFMALANNGWVWTWGQNQFGQLGSGLAKKNQYSIKIFKVSSLDNVQAISGGIWHSLALKKDGTIWAWGLNSKGQLGDGSKENKLIAVQSGIAPPEIIKPTKTKKEKQWSGPIYH